MKKTFFWFTAALLLISSISFAQWQPDVRLTFSPDTSRLGYHNGNIASVVNFVHVFWYDKRDGNFEIYYKRSTDGGNNWSSDIRLTNNPGNSQMPSCALNGSIVHVVWNDNTGGTYQVYYKRSTDAGVTWSADTMLTNVTPPAAGYFYPHMSLSGLLMFIVWYENRDGNNEIYYKCSTDGGVSWGADTRLTNDPAMSSLPSVVLSGSNVHIVWNDQRDGNYEIYYKLSTNGGVSWGSDTRLTNDPASSERPSISISNSVLHIVWFDTRDGNQEIYYKLNPTGNPVGIVQVNSEIPKEYKLMQNYPNPFNPTTKIRFALPKSSFAKLVVYDALGRELETLVNEQLKSGTYEVDWDGTNYSSGVYFYKLIVGDPSPEHSGSGQGFSQTNKMILTK